jgi:AAHS family 4-hydroxybenzoate transporter-like MFS transporter
MLNTVDVAAGGSQDIGTLLDAGAWTSFQKLVVAFAAFSIILDGFDGQMIGFAIPSLIKAWGLPRGAFTPVVVAGLAGMAIGSGCAGLIADRFGRRVAIILSVMVFAAATFAIGFAPDIRVLGILRFIAGLGVGGALPTSTTLAAEFTPMRRRIFAVTITIVCVPLGGVAAGLFAHRVLPAYGWQGLFWIGGGLSMVLGLALLALLPESPRYLARRPARWPELGRLLGRMSRQMPTNATFSDAEEQKVELRKGIPALFEKGRVRDTLGLASSFFLNLLAVYFTFSWLPTLLASEGMSVTVAGSGLTAYNFGGIFGALLCALAISKFGSRGPMVFCAAGGAATAFILSHHTGTGSLTLLLGLHGLFVNAVQSTMTALCTYVYVTNVRATGTAFSLAIGRLGAISAGFIGAAIITAGGAHAYFGLLAVVLSLTVVTLLLIRHHVPPHRAA